MKHVSSFIGNVGDVLSNYGLSSYLTEKSLNELEKIEIRDFYRNVTIEKRRSFDELFSECQQAEQTLIIGGGGFLDYWVDGSRTATTIDVDLELLAKTNFKLIITSVGSFPHKHFAPSNIERFVEFMTALSKRKNTHVMLRNDGSYQELQSVLPRSVLETVHNGADNAYLLEPKLKSMPKTVGDYVVFNVALDQLFMKSKFRDGIDFNHFKCEVIKTVEYVVKAMGKKVVLVPHLVSDVKFYVELCEDLEDLMVRRDVKIFSYSGQEKDIHSYIDIYANSYANVCTRLHSNILSVMLDKKTISLCVLDRVRNIAEQHENLFKIIELEETFSDLAISYLKKAGFKSNVNSNFNLLDKFYSEYL